MNADDEILVWRHLDGSATPDEVDRLSRRLAEDPAVCRAFVEISRIQAALHGVPARRASPLWPRVALAALLALAVGAGAWALLRSDAPAPGDTLAGGPAGRAVALADGTILALAPGAALIVPAPGDPWELERGALAATVAPQAPDRPWRIRTPHAEATVLGTAFRLDAGDRGTRLEVDHGRVRFTQGADTLVAGAGQELVAIPGRGLQGGDRRPPGMMLVRIDAAGGVPPGLHATAAADAAVPSGRAWMAVSSSSGAIRSVRWEDWRQGLWRSRPGQHLVLTVRIPAAAAWADVWVGLADGSGRRWNLEGVPRDRWWRVVVPLDRLIPSKPPTRSRLPDPDEPIHALFIQAPAGAPPLAVAGIEVVDPP
ncbi:MAG: hypothetical protein RLZZ127_2902 [Planctomycetota bacterium]|jgi:hypothetical protein